MLIRFNNISKSFLVNSQPLPALARFSLDIAAGEFVAVVGASGCGKSTLLRLLAGLDNDYEGEITINNRPVTGISPQVGMVFQEPRLFPWLTVGQNIALGLADTQLSQRQKLRQASRYAHMVGLAGFDHAWVHQLSGGMAQRVAIARGLVSQPHIFLLDEPFAALDAVTRHQLQDKLAAIHQQTALTVILVTHDVEEALFLADRIVVMTSRPGSIRQIMPVDILHPRDRGGVDIFTRRENLYRQLSENPPIG